MVYICMYICIYVCMYICIYVCMYICIYVYMYICMYVYVCSTQFGKTHHLEMCVLQFLNSDVRQSQHWAYSQIVQNIYIQCHNIYYINI